MEQIEVRILDRDYRLAVSDSGRSQLLEAVRMVDDRMRSIRDAGKILAPDRIAVIVALQLAGEMLGAKVPGSSLPAGEFSRKVRQLTDDIASEIARQPRAL